MNDARNEAMNDARNEAMNDARNEAMNDARNEAMNGARKEIGPLTHVGGSPWESNTSCSLYRHKKTGGSEPPVEGNFSGQ